MLEIFIAKKWVEKESEEAFVSALIEDGASPWSINEVVSLCERGDFASAAAIAHADGWL